jgi:putative ABC transport system permease protein
MLALGSDLKYTVRALSARPSFTFIVVFTLALGIGANTVIFSAVQALLLRPFPFREPEQLVRISSMKGGEEGPLSVPEQDDLAALSDVIEDIALYTDLGMYNASGFGDPEELPATITTSNLFRLLGIEPILGSTFPAESDRTRRFELVISHGLWSRRFGQDPNIVGRTMTLDGAPGYTIHGVLPPGMNFPSHSDLFRSSGIAADPKWYQRRDIRGRMAVARLRKGVSLSHAREQIDRLSERLARDFPQTNVGLRFRVIPIRDLYVANVRPYVLLLFGAVVLVLLVACANVVNLLLSRALARDRELAVRVALGAGRGRVVRQLVGESVLLSLVGGAAGLGLTFLGINMLNRLSPVQFPSWMQIRVDRTILLFLVTVSIGTGLVAGALPAVRSADRGLREALQGARTSTGSRRQHRVRNAIVVVEVALALVLLVGASLMLQSVLRLQRVHPGFEANNLLSFRVELGWRAYDSHAKVIAFNDRLLGRLQTLPGVVAVGLDANLPLSGTPREPLQIVADGQSLELQHENPFVHQHVVNPGYFQAMQIPIEQGRALDEADTAESQPVAVVSRRLADRLWPGGDALGRRIKVGSSATTPWVVVVGVAGDVKLQRLAGTASLALYRSYRQLWAGGSWFVLKTRGVHPSSLARMAPGLVSEIDPNQSYFDVQVMEDRIAAGIWPQRASGVLFGAFAALALTLAAVGLYGVLAYGVTQQRREIGVRLALGADPRTVRRMVVRRGLTLTAIGIGIGTAAALIAAQVMKSVLYEISAIDAPTFLGVPIVLVVIALAACYHPARRATRVDPVMVLRNE